jgi:branched-chain amino acid transport system substrate-binding protein
LKTGSFKPDFWQFKIQVKEDAMKKKVWRALVVVGLVLIVSSYVWAERPIRIYVNEPLSGPAKDLGDRAVLGAQFAAEEANAQGGVLGRKVEAFGDDNQSKPDVAARKTQKYLLEENVDLIICGNGTPIAKAIAETIKGQNVCFFAGTMADDITGKDFQYNVFRAYYTGSMFARATVTYLSKYKNIKTFYLLNQDYSFGHDCAAAFRREVETRVPDGKILGEDYFPLFSKDLSPFLTKIKATGAGSILSTAWGSDINLLLKQRQELGVKGVIVNHALADYLAVKAVPESAVGAIAGDMYFMTIDTPENKDFVRRWQQRYKGTEFPDPDPHVVRTYVGVKFYLEAAKKAKSVDVDKIMPVLEGFRMKSLNGEIWLRPCDHQIQTPFAVAEITSGKYPYYSVPTLLPASAVGIEESLTGNSRCKK